MGLNTRKAVFGVSKNLILKSACSATETNLKIEMLLVGSFDRILSKKQITKALISLQEGAGWSAPLSFANPEDRFSSVKAHMIVDLWSRLTLKGPPIICSRRQFQILPLFQKQQIRHDIS